MNRRDVLTLAGKVGLVALAAQVPWSWLERAGLLGEALSEAAALPQNYRVTTGAILADTQLGLSGITGHQVHSGDATWSVSNETGAEWLRPLGVTNVFKAQVTQAGTGTSQYRFDFTISRALADIYQFHWPIYYTGGGSPSVLFYVAKEAGFTNYYTYDFASAGLVSDRWNYKTHVRSAPGVTTGSPAYSDTFVRVRMRISIPAGQTGTFYIGPICYGWYGKPQIVFTFDDGDVTFYTEAFAYMRPRGIPGSVALNREGSGTPLSVAQVQEMIEAGWSFHNHSDTHQDLATLSETQIAAQVQGAIDYWAGQGITLDPHTFILPFGSRNALVDTVLARYYRYVMLATGASFPLWDGVQNPLKIYRQVIDVPTSTATTIGAMNTAQQHGNALIYMGHKLASGAVSGHTEIANFKALADEVYRRKEANSIQVRNLADLFTGLTNPRRKRL